MQTVPLTHKSASAKLILNGDGTAKLVNVQSTQRSMGHATELMQALTQVADEQKLTIDLEVMRFGNQIEGSMNNQQLVRFYLQFGFEKVSMRNPIKMRRTFRETSQE